METPFLIEIVPGIGDEDFSESEDAAVNLILHAGRGGKFGYGESLHVSHKPAFHAVYVTWPKVETQFLMHIVTLLVLGITIF